jgi:putative serine protease PepD
MSNPWNPQNNEPGDPETPSGPSEPQHQPQQSPPVEQTGWAAAPGSGPFASGSAWPGAPTSQSAAHDPNAATAPGGSGYYPPNDFTFTDAPTSGNGSGGASIGKRVAAGAVVVLLMLGSGATGAVIAGNDNDEPSASTRTTATVENASAEPATQTLAKVAAAVQPSVVSIEVTTRGGGGDTGSGFILHNDGTIVTNNHVIAAAANSTTGAIAVKFFDGETAPATIVGRDPSTDLAVIKVNNVPNLVAASLGSSNTLHVGDTVVALGSPLGLEGSVSSGIVSALHRTVELGAEDGSGALGRQPAQRSLVADAIQTDAAINPGNSGGPLVDINGKVVGVNTAIASLGASATQSGSIGVGFAIPIDEVQSVAEQLIRGETPKHALLGVQISDDEDGALIQDVTAGGAAEKAGLEVGDVVTKFDDRRIDSADSLSAAVRTKDPEQKVTLTYERDGQTRTAEVTLGSSTE